MLKLTERETEVVRLRDEEGLAWNEIAKLLGTSKGGANSSYRTAKAKRNREPRAFAQTCEVKSPERTAEALDLATDPFTSIRAAAKACGFPNRTLDMLIKRMATRYAPLDAEIRKAKKDEIETLLEDRGRRALEYLDDFALAQSSARDLAVIAGIAIDKTQLLAGEPTHIHKITDLPEIDRKLAEIHAEMERRGMIDVTPKKEDEGEPRS